MEFFLDDVTLKYPINCEKHDIIIFLGQSKGTTSRPPNQPLKPFIIIQETVPLSFARWLFEYINEMSKNPNTKFIKFKPRLTNKF